MSDTIKNDKAPPLHPEIPREELERMSLKDQADYLGKLAISSGNRYRGRPELLLKEHPHRDFERRFRPKQ